MFANLSIFGKSLPLYPNTRISFYPKETLVFTRINKNKNQCKRKNSGPDY